MKKNGVPDESECVLLRILVEKPELYGLDIIKEVGAQGPDVLRLLPQMEKEGLVVSRVETMYLGWGPMRRRYRATDRGRIVVERKNQPKKKTA